MRLTLVLLFFASNSLSADDSCARMHIMLEWYLPAKKLDEASYKKLYGMQPMEWLTYMTNLDAELNQSFPEYGEDENFLSYSYIDEASKEEISMQWAEDIEKIALTRPAIGSKTSPIKMKKLSDDVFSFLSEGKKYIARNVDTKTDIYALTQGRAAMVASKVEEHFGFDIYPNFQPQKINGRTYLLTDFAKGETVGLKRSTNAASTYLKALEDGSLKKETYWLGQGFSFLLGDKDSDSTNAIKRPDGRMLLVDPGQALSFGADAYASDRSQNAFDYTPFGLVLPYRYSRKFIEKLEEMDRDSWEDALIDEALDEEISMIMYRQRLILLDIAARGEAAYFD